MSKQRLQQETTSSEFVEWKVFLFEILPNDFDPVLDHLAKVCLEVRRFWSELARKTTSLDEYRIKYVKKKLEDEGEPEVPPEERMARSKAAWAAIISVAKIKKGKVELPEKVRKRTEEFRHGIRN